jgi:hypothetical protein
MVGLYSYRPATLYHETTSLSKWKRLHIYSVTTVGRFPAFHRSRPTRRNVTMCFPGYKGFAASCWIRQCWLRNSIHRPVGKWNYFGASWNFNGLGVHCLARKSVRIDQGSVPSSLWVTTFQTKLNINLKRGSTPVAGGPWGTHTHFGNDVSRVCRESHLISGRTLC